MAVENVRMLQGGHTGVLELDVEQALSEALRPFVGQRLTQEVRADIDRAVWSAVSDLYRGIDDARAVGADDFVVVARAGKPLHISIERAEVGQEKS